MCTLYVTAVPECPPNVTQFSADFVFTKGLAYFVPFYRSAAAAVSTCNFVCVS